MILLSVWQRSMATTEKMGKMMIVIEKVLLEEKPSTMLVEGSVNTVVAVSRRKSRIASWTR